MLYFGVKKFKCWYGGNYWFLGGELPSGTSHLYLGNGVIVCATTTGTANFASGNFNSSGTNFWSEDLAGDTSLGNKVLLMVDLWSPFPY